MLITHSHHDHIVLETLLQLRHKVKTVVVGRNLDGFPQDPSMELALRKLGFDDVLEVRDAQEIKLPGGAITAIPFMGEHNDLAIHSKQSFMVRFGSRSVLCIADSCNLDPRLYEHVFRLAGKPDTLFVGMETEARRRRGSTARCFRALPRHRSITPGARLPVRRGRRAGGRFRVQRGVCLCDGSGAVAEPPARQHLRRKLAQPHPVHQFVAHCRAKGIASEILYAKRDRALSQLNLNALSTSGQYQEHVAFWTDALGRLDEDFRLQQAWQAYALPLGQPTLTFALDGDAAPVLEKLAAGNALGAFVVLAALFRVLGRRRRGGLFVASPP